MITKPEMTEKDQQKPDKIPEEIIKKPLLPSPPSTN